MWQGLTIATWLWGDYPATGIPDLARRCRQAFPDHEFVVLTQPGSTPRVQAVLEAQLPAKQRSWPVNVFEVDLGDLWVLPDPARQSLVSISFPPCYVRLYLWSQEFAALLAKHNLPMRVLQLDLDSVPVDDCTDLVAAPVIQAEPVVLMNGASRIRGGRQWSRYSGAQLLITAGAVPDLWERFTCEVAREGRATNTLPGSDQQIISQYLGPGRPTWSAAAGIWRARELPSSRIGATRSTSWLPPGARMVHFSAHAQPWTPKAKQAHPWLEHV